MPRSGIGLNELLDLLPVPMAEAALGRGGWISELIMQRLKNGSDCVRLRLAVLLLKRIGNVPDGVRQEDAPSRRFITAVVLPQANLDRAVLPLLSNPGAEHLDGLFISLCCWWDDEWLHSRSNA